MGQQMAMPALEVAVLMNPDPGRSVAMPGDAFREQIGKAPGGIGHAMQGNACRLPMNRDHAVEGQAKDLGVAYRIQEVGHLGGGQGLALPVGAVAGTAPTDLASQIGSDTYSNRENDCGV
ncbi:hypothetical protein DBR41_20700 [Pseudomonas sp. HMWF010]|nr:hypothetical protein DBR21_14935 [Caulobacter sp. HMWF009]PTT11833.1 hypothetical protein DBR10_02855 [Caulobacter sp. HMWF025]PTT80000.1 hypothetical protein DBR41_20700 [Pseudomonas sp. HMWF010]